MIGVIIQDQNECVDLLKDKFKDVFSHNIVNYKFYVVKTFNEQDAIICFCGFGKVNASIAASLMINSFNIDLCLNIGTCLGVNLVEELDVLIADKCSYCDVDATNLGFELNQIPELPNKFDCDTKINNQIMELLNYGNFQYKLGIVYSCETIYDQKKIALNNFFKNSLSSCIDNNACAINQVCYKLNKKFVCLKIVDKIINNKINEQNQAKAKIMIETILINLIDSLSYFKGEKND